MNAITTEASNKKGSYKSHIVPAVVTAAIALSAAIPLTAAFASNAVSADSAPAASVTKTVASTDDNSCNAPAATTSSHGAVQGASTSVTTATKVVDHYVYPSVNGNGNGSGNGNSGQGNGNGNGSGSNANGNTQTNNGGLIGGVNAIVPVSALNGSLNGILSGNGVAVSVPVLSNNDGNSTNVLNNLLNTVTNLL